MDATLLFSASAQPQVTPITSPVAAPSSASSPVGVTEQPQSNTPNGRIFAGLMRDLLPTHERQDVAASEASDPADLKSESLGSELEVITATNGPPDATSLSAFARAQGLDESAVLALFGEKSHSVSMPSMVNEAVAAMSKVLTSEVLPTPENQAKDVAWLANALSAEITLDVYSIPKEESPLKTDNLETSPLTIPTLTTANWLATQLASLVQLPQSSLAQSSVQVNQVPVIDKVTNWSQSLTTALLRPSLVQTEFIHNINGLEAVGGKPPLASSLNVMNADTQPLLMQTLDIQTSSAPGSSESPAQGFTAEMLTLNTATLAAKTNAASVAVSELFTATHTSAALPPTDASTLSATTNAANVAVSELPPKPLKDAMRIRLVPAWANVTQKLSQMSGTALTAPWSTLTAATLGSPIRTIVLDLQTSEVQDADATTLNLDTPTANGLTGTPSELNRNISAGGQVPTPAQPLPSMNQMIRQEHYQFLADRLGQAMAERLQSQIARGEWKLQMRLNPASLGRIDVELDMHAKGLDASFRSDNPLTRELMAQSMPKLKDSLTQSGMAVATVWVNNDAGRQSDGNPTPQKESEPGSDNVASDLTDTATKAVTKEKRTPDGFDVLA